MSRGLSSFAVGLVLLSTGCGAGSANEQAAAVVHGPASVFKGSAVEGRVAAPGFTLRDQAGRPVSLAAQRGRSVVVAFLYTRCPDVCPLIASNLNTALRQLGPRRSALRVLAVSVDPKHDTPAAVRRYVRVHRLLPQFRYLIGSHAQLARVWKAYHVAVVQNPNGSIAGHTTFEVLIDPGGNERVLYDSSVTAADVLHDLPIVERGR